MENLNIAEYRARAETCSRQAELTSDPASKLHRLDMAKGWLILADNLAKKDVHDHIDKAA
jgi:hypothetical protein